MLELSRRWPFIGILLSALVLRSGTAVTSFALPWLVHSLTSSSLWTSIAVSICLIASVIGALSGGIMIDRIGPTATIRIAGLCGAAAIALVPLLHQYGMLSPLILIPLVVITTIFDSAASSVQDSRIPEIASLAEIPLPRAIATKSVIGYVASLGAPLIAGAVAHEWGTALILWHSAISLLLGGGIASIAIALCDDSSPAARPPADLSVFVNLATIWRDVDLRTSIIVTAGAVAIIGATSGVLVPGLLKIQAGDIQEYGGFVAAISGGSMLGSAIYGTIGDRLQVRVLNTGGFALMSVSMALLGSVFSSPFLYVAGIMLGIAVSPMAAAMSVLLYRRVEVQLRGRSFGVISAIMMCVTPLTMVTIGYAVDGFGPRAVLIGLAVVAAIAMVVVQFQRHQKIL